MRDVNMWRYCNCFYKDDPLVEVVFHAALKRRPVVIGKNQFRSFKNMDDLICFLGYSRKYEIEVNNKIINKYGPALIYKEFCILIEKDCVHIRMRPLYGRT
jgi:hypothetical protein